ncbi:uncharacterized protein LOC128158817 [Crassostrea angulata]|uniref:uncharacterized protein LOC128158817 n=1 Tax=Magallana angulata TaxID=2784310 RepID=UPI0022B1FAFA|nr:uncharacterized protein LOC128158817 [Crassostrea angulata]
MDPRSSAQDIHRCDLCETAIVHSYCDFCHVNLCKPCIGDHISDGYHKHTIVPFYERRSTLIYPKCGTHSNKHCELHCKDCRSFVCSSCMASEQHIGHRFVEVKHEFETKKEIIKKEKIELGNSISPKYEEIAFELEIQLANLDEGYEKLTAEISKQGEEWHREIDIVINKMKTEINEIKLKHESILKKHLHEIKQMQSLIKETFIVLGKLEKSTEISTAIEYISKIKIFSKLPPRVNVLLPTFIPKPIDHEHFYNFFGQIIPLCNATQENALSINQPKTAVRELLDKPELVATIQTGYNALYIVTCLNDEIFWTCGEFDGIKCFDVKGNLLRTIKTNYRRRSNDIAVDGDGDLLYSDWGTTTVYKVKNQQRKELIRLQGWKPLNLCVTSTGDLLVTMYNDDETQSKVVRYSGSAEKQTIQFDDEGKPLYSGNGFSKNITENRNHDICVADYKAGAVVVVNEDTKLRWRYSGYRSTTKNKPFQPQGITTDSRSRILTVDGYNHCIHILNQDGQFLRYIDNCDLRYPFGLCVDKKDNLFVCDCANGNVRKIKYSKDI